MFAETLEKQYSDLEEIKRAMFIASPAEFATKVYPEIFGADEFKPMSLDEIEQNDTIYSESPEMEMDLQFPELNERMKIAALLDNTSGTLQL